MLLTTQFSGQGARCGTDFDMSGRIIVLTNENAFGLDHHIKKYTTLWLCKPEFDSRIGHHVKKSKRGAC